MELYIWPSDFGLPSIETKCLQFMACAKFCAAPVSVIPSCSPWKCKKGVYPVFVNKAVDENSEVTEFDEFAAILRKSAQLHFLWIDHWNYSTVTAHWYSSQLLFPYGLYYLERGRRRAQAYVAACGRSEAQLIRDAIMAINLLSAKLGDNKYFYGDRRQCLLASVCRPSSLDALIFGYLAPILKLPLPSDRLQQHILGCPNLVRFIESIISIYLPLTETQIRLQAASKDKWQMRRARAQKSAERMQIRRETVDEEASVLCIRYVPHFHNGRGVADSINSTAALPRLLATPIRPLRTLLSGARAPIRDTVIFAVGALTLSILFAVHLGIVSVSLEEETPIDID
uniref:GST_C_6 domain-containing protein n=1 Tax=Ascaris lumbricoides TaxID=6252 RepID=A0A0M3I682_ASCLU